MVPLLAHEHLGHHPHRVKRLRSKQSRAEGGSRVSVAAALSGGMPGNHPAGWRRSGGRKGAAAACRRPASCSQHPLHPPPAAPCPTSAYHGGLVQDGHQLGAREERLAIENSLTEPELGDPLPAQQGCRLQGRLCTVPIPVCKVASSEEVLLACGAQGKGGVAACSGQPGACSCLGALPTAAAVSAWIGPQQPNVTLNAGQPALTHAAVYPRGIRSGWAAPWAAAAGTTAWTSPPSCSRPCTWCTLRGPRT